MPPLLLWLVALWLVPLWRVSLWRVAIELRQGMAGAAAARRAGRAQARR